LNIYGEEKSRSFSCDKNPCYAYIFDKPIRGDLREDKSVVTKRISIDPWAGAEKKLPSLLLGTVCDSSV
jgi:hypothetical protein